MAWSSADSTDGRPSTGPPDPTPRGRGKDSVEEGESHRNASQHRRVSRFAKPLSEAHYPCYLLRCDHQKTAESQNVPAASETGRSKRIGELRDEGGRRS